MKELLEFADKNGIKAETEVFSVTKSQEVLDNIR